jgi:hypothetical protein
MPYDWLDPNPGEPDWKAAAMTLLGICIVFAIIIVYLATSRG